jgi:broad specificity phosphatase PhoE
MLNVAGLVNGNPSLDRGLSPAGVEEATRLAAQIAGHAVELCVTSEFRRAQETARLALTGRSPVTTRIDPDLNDIRVGGLEGKTLDEYRRWKHAHTRADRFPGGESLDEAAGRYAVAFERLAGSDADTILCVCHEIPVRYAVNAAAGSDDLDAPHHNVANAAPYVFDEAGLLRAVERLRR